MTQAQNHTDIIDKGWVGRAPQSIRPYLYLMRLDRPIGTWLLLLPAWWSMLLAWAIYDEIHVWKHMIAFAIGALIMRGAGCVINDIWDRDLDGSVERTATRPIPNEDVTTRQAIIFLCFLLSIGLGILLQFNTMTIIIGIVSVVFVITYPLMKRITWWPQAFLGLTFNFGALMGWSAVVGEMSWQPWVLYIAGIFWTLGYDTIYAFQDCKDDAIIGIKSSARWMVERIKINFKILLYLFYLIHFLLFLSVIAIEVDFYVSFLSLIPLILLLNQVRTLDIHSPQNALAHFQANRNYGLLMCGVIVVCKVIDL